MMERRTRIIFVVALLAIFVLIYLLIRLPTHTPEGGVIAYSAKGAALEAPVYGEESPASQIAAAGANEFALRLSARLLAGRERDNFICAPYSVWLPLAALTNAADEDSRAQLLTALGADGLSAAEINRASSRMLFDLTGERERQYYPEAHNPLRIAGAVFVDRRSALKDAFAQAFMDFYRGQALEVDFSSPQAADAVNQWASEHTEGLIDALVEGFDPNTVAALASALYFSDRWASEFSAEQTEEGAFYGVLGEGRAQFMRRTGDEQRYFEDARIQAMPLAFNTGGALYILLPKDGDASGLLASMDDAYFREIRGGMEALTGTLLLPRFRIDGGVLDLTEALEALGVPLFDKNRAPLTGGLIEGEDPVWLARAAHRAMIEVDEKGTTAAAVTSLMADAAADPEPTEPFEMICNRPFVFILCGWTYDGGEQILMTGVVNAI